MSRFLPSANGFGTDVRSGEIAMGRPLTPLSALLCAAALAATAPAALPATATASAAVRGTVTGKVTYIGASSLTIQTPGKRVGLINAMISTANAVGARDYPYVWAGGHAQAGIASTGSRGPGYNGHRVGFDCSGSVAAVLAGAGLWAPGSPVPGDAAVVRQLLQEHLIARGAGTAPSEVTLYDDPGFHIFMSIDGRFFGTSDGGGGDSKGGPAWLDDGAPDATNHAYRRYHVLPSVLRTRAFYGHSVTFKLHGYDALASDAAAGDAVEVSYVEAKSGVITATSVQMLSPTAP